MRSKITKKPKPLSPGAERLREYMREIYATITWPPDLK
jgi:hypothetical protein